MRRSRNGVVINLLGSGRQSTGDREYFHKIPTLDLCRQLWDNNFEAHHSWDSDEKPAGDEEQKWEKIDVSEWIKRKRNIIDFNAEF